MLLEGCPGITPSWRGATPDDQFVDSFGEHIIQIFVVLRECKREEGFMSGNRRYPRSVGLRSRCAKRHCTPELEHTLKLIEVGVPVVDQSLSPGPSRCSSVASIDASIEHLCDMSRR